MTLTGKEFYLRAVEVVNLYTEIWRHPIRIHFLHGLENEAAMFASQLPKECWTSFDEENFDSGISRLINENYDLPIGFQLAFTNNNKIE